MSSQQNAQWTPCLQANCCGGGSLWVKQYPNVEICMTKFTNKLINGGYPSMLSNVPMLKSLYPFPSNHKFLMSSSKSSTFLIGEQTWLLEQSVIKLMVLFGKTVNSNNMKMAPMKMTSMKL